MPGHGKHHHHHGVCSTASLLIDDSTISKQRNQSYVDGYEGNTRKTQTEEKLYVARHNIIRLYSSSSNCFKLTIETS